MQTKTTHSQATDGDPPAGSGPQPAGGMEADDREPDYGSPFDPAFGVPDEVIGWLPQPLAVTSAGLPPEPRTPPQWRRAAVAVIGTVAVAVALAFLLTGWLT